MTPPLVFAEQVMTPRATETLHLQLDEGKPMSSRKTSSTRRQSAGRAGKFAVPPTPHRADVDAQLTNSFTLSAHLLVRI